MKLSSFFILAKVCVAFFYKVSTAESLKEEEVELSTNTNRIKPLLESYHGRAVSFEANDASQATDFAAIHVHDASMKVRVSSSLSVFKCVVNEKIIVNFSVLHDDMRIICCTCVYLYCSILPNPNLFQIISHHF